MHPHWDIESLTYVVEGHFLHADSLRNNGHLEPGAAQVMTFSHRGDQHSERSDSGTEPLRFIQFWILPSTSGLETSVQQHQFDVDDRTDRWLQIMGSAGEDGLDLAQDARVLVSRITAAALEYSFGTGRGGYFYVIDGEVPAGDDDLAAADAMKIYGPEDMTVTSRHLAEVILVDVPLDFQPVGVWAGER